MLKSAIVRPPSRSFAEGLTQAGLGKPDPQLAASQHASYVEALLTCGLAVVSLEPDDRYPDSPFVEDAAVVVGDSIVITRPGAESRRGEVEAVRQAAASLFDRVLQIDAPGTVDGGDVCEADGRFLIGLSSRTNVAGAEQLARLIESCGRAAAIVDVRALPGLLHFKTGIAALGDGVFVCVPELAGHPALQARRTFVVDVAEAYAANCVRVNDRVLVAAGFPRIEKALGSAGYATIALDVSEFRKMDGGLSCLSIRTSRPTR
jgi:dimethylargininase